MSLVDDVDSTNSSPLIDELASLESSSRRSRAPSRFYHRDPRRWKRSVNRSAEKEAVDSQKKAVKDQENKSRRKKELELLRPKETLKLVAGVSAFVAVIAVLAWGYPELRIPLGGFLFVIGFIVYVLGSVSLRQLVAEEGVLKLLFFRFCPPYQWWYVATHWAETRDFVAFFLAGCSHHVARRRGHQNVSRYQQAGRCGGTCLSKDAARAIRSEAPPRYRSAIAHDD